MAVFRNLSGWVGEEIDGKGAVKNLFTNPSHSHYIGPFSLELDYSLIFAREGQTSLCRLGHWQTEEGDPIN